jgi:hypothetical protein
MSKGTAFQQYFDTLGKNPLGFRVTGLNYHLKEKIMGATMKKGENGCWSHWIKVSAAFRARSRNGAT